MFNCQTGVAAILRFPIADLDEEDWAEGNNNDNEDEQQSNGGNNGQLLT
jgi:hypothetical protein